MINQFYDIITIGGSAGSIPILIDLLDGMPDYFSQSVIIVLHRLKNVQSEMDRLLSVKQRITEPEDKEMIVQGGIYLAPQNYHLQVEDDHSFSLDYSELVNYSRPSIDVAFSSIAAVYRSRVLGILLSGANKDGAAGLSCIISAGGTGIVQDPQTALYGEMPQSAIEINNNVKVMDVGEIISFIDTVSK
ncbi:chemotaxis protein CheB [Chitinophaga defluvii]|uniref:protein-glutamate methylesterase n=1 Tax=Chitinophaga defluvii TaxID=3163343 RepID=A0ABV2T4N6_9BACT